MTTDTIPPTYHVLLIGIDRYPPGYNSLSGCVNDIDAIEQLLLTPPGVGIPPERIRITRLVAPRADPGSTSAPSAVPTKANLVAALQALAGPDVEPSDRVLIYYSGHGDEKRWIGSSVWHEALVPCDDHQVEYLFDVELNTLINAIAARTSDLTIVLDACHSAGATRDLDDGPAGGAVRALKSDLTPISPPNLTALGLAGDAAQDRGVASHLLQSPNPDYLVVVACQSDEKAGEGSVSQGQPVHGVFTHSLLSVLDQQNAAERAELRWADIWPNLLATAMERNGQLCQRAQHPWIIGHGERRVFGGRWEPMDLGYRVTTRPDGGYDIGAGRLMGVTEGAEIAVYGDHPLRFPPLGSAEDRPIGRLKVTGAEPSAAVAIAAGAAFALPQGARGRLVRPGASDPLRISLKPADAALQAQLEHSPLLQIGLPDLPDAEVEVITQPGGGWILGNEVEPVIATVPAGEIGALRAGLEYYYRYQTVLRLARNCNSVELSNSLSVRLLDCNDSAALAAMTPEMLADPNLPEAPRDQDRVYALWPGYRFCVKVANNSPFALNVTLLNCSAGGLIEYLSDAEIRSFASHVMWLDNKLGDPFPAGADALPTPPPGTSVPSYTTERMIAIGATRKDLDLRFLTLDKRVQEVVEDNLSTRRGGEKSLRGQKASSAPAELWTATTTPIRIAR